MESNPNEIAKQIYELMETHEDSSIFISEILKAEKTKKMAITKTPLLNSIGKELGKLISSSSWKYEQLKKLWESGKREDRLIVISALGVLAKKEYKKAKGFILSIINDISDWEICDQLAMRAIVHLAVQNPAEMFSLMHDWSQSTHLWIRRLSIATLPSYIRARPNESERCLKLIDEVMQDSEKDVKKAASWALREISKKEPEAVFEFLKKWAHADNKNTKWIIKDGMKKLSQAQQEEIRQLMKSKK